MDALGELILMPDLLMDIWLTAQQVADFLQCHIQTVYRDKELPHVKIPGIGWRCRFEDLERYIAARAVSPTQKLPYPSDNASFMLPQPPELGTIISGGLSEMPKGKTRTRINFGYGAIYQRKTKEGKIRWYLDYRDADGKRIQKVAPAAATSEEATLALRAEVTKVFDQLHGVKRRRECIGFQEFSSPYLKDYAMSVKKSWRTDENRLKILKSYFKQSDLRDITPLSIQRFISKREKIGNAKSTINRYLALLKKMFNLAIEEGYLEQNPMSKVKLFSEKDNKKERILTESEEIRLLEASSSHLRSMIIIALNTGMRRGEILQLKWDQIDLKNRLITVKRTKSGRDRQVPINLTLHTELSLLQATRSTVAHVFTHEQTGLPLDSIKTAFGSACRRSGIENLRFHDLRHTFASRLIQNGVDVETVRSLLGHSSILITQRYVHSTDERKKKAVAVLANNQPVPQEKAPDLLHMCDMDDTSEAEEKDKSSANGLFSVN